MNPNYVLYDYDYKLKEIIDEGDVKSNRTGIDALSIFGVQCRYSIDKFFPIPTRRKYPYKSIFSELLWMLSGSTNVNDLEAMNSKIWSAWRDKEFERRNGYADGELGPIYGHQFRNFGGDYNIPNGFDQVSFIVNELRNNKFSRRIIINLWDAKVVNGDTVRLPPCHFNTQFLVDNKDRLTTILTQRSGDFLPGISANILFYSALSYMLAQQCGLKPYELIHNIGDAHVYTDQLTAANTYLQRGFPDSPKLTLLPAKDIFSYKLDNFIVSDYTPLDPIKIPVAV